MKKNKTAIIIVSHNSKEMTSKLCKNIIDNTKSDYELLVVETGSDKKEITDYPTLYVPDGIRMTRGFNWGIRYLLWKESLQSEFYFDSFWIVVNDAIFENNKDTLTPLVTFLRSIPDCGEIHPYFTENSCSNQLKKSEGLARKESFCEIVCPLLSRKAIDLNIIDDIFFYGWGLDYSMVHELHKNSLRLYVSNEVSVEHHSGTTVLSGKDEDFKNKKEQFDKSRQNMKEGLIKKYGENWFLNMLKAIPEDVDPTPFKDWVLNNGDFVLS